MLPGELAFAGEPIVTVTAPLLQAQLLETLLINTVGLETMIASKAARVRLACAGRSFVDFSARRDHGLEAAARRGARLRHRRGGRHVAGGGGPALRPGAVGHDGPLLRDGPRATSGTRSAPTSASTGRRRSCSSTPTTPPRACARRWRRCGPKGWWRGRSASTPATSAPSPRRPGPSSTRPGSSRCRSWRRVISTRTRIAALVAAGAPIDAFGVGTRLGTSADAPYLGMVYKLVEQGGQPRLKLSPGKHTSPGRKQVWRSDGADVIALGGEAGSGRRPAPAADGATTARRPAPWALLAEARDRCAAALASWTGRAPAVRVSERPRRPGHEGLSQRRAG